MSLKVLVVEDDREIRAMMQSSLSVEGFEVQTAVSLSEARALLVHKPPDLVVLDLGLPDGDGVDLIRDLRQWSAIPVFVLSARGAEADKVAALDAGADDYLVKPFGAGELMARVRAQLRRHQQQTASGETTISFGDVSVDLVRRVVERNGEPLHLTPIEYKLLTHLASQPDRVITHQQLLKAVWGPGHADDTHYVRVHMANLRKKVEAKPSMPAHFLTEAGIGYRFVR